MTQGQFNVGNPQEVIFSWVGAKSSLASLVFSFWDAFVTSLQR